MKYLKLFENHEAAQPELDLSELMTLRDAVNPEDFAWGDDEDDYLSALSAARWTCAQLGIAEPVGAHRLMQLGLTDLAGLAKRLGLDEVIEVFNSLSTSWHDGPRFSSLVHKFPDLLSITENEYSLGYNDHTAKLIASEKFATLRAEVREGPDSGVRAVMWVADPHRFHVVIWMLRKDLLAG